MLDHSHCIPETNSLLRRGAQAWKKHSTYCPISEETMGLLLPTSGVPAGCTDGWRVESGVLVHWDVISQLFPSEGGVCFLSHQSTLA
jgi:hypothetical protein